MAPPLLSLLTTSMLLPLVLAVVPEQEILAAAKLSAAPESLADLHCQRDRLQKDVALDYAAVQSPIAWEGKKRVGIKECWAALWPSGSVVAGT